MTDEQRYTDLIALGRRVRNCLPGIIREIDSVPDGEGPAGVALVTWRLVLLILIYDISDSALLLAEARSQQIRAIKILNRSLFEYMLRLEFYIDNYKTAAKDWVIAQRWLRDVVKKIGAEALKDFSKTELRLYNDMIKVEGDFEYPSLALMLRGALKARGMSKRDIKHAVREGTRLYAIASSLSHGSQGAFYDIIEEQPPPRKPILHFRSLRFTEYDVLNETVLYLIESLAAEQLHQGGRDFGAALFARDFELITGLWQPVVRYGEIIPAISGEKFPTPH